MEDLVGAAAELAPEVPEAAVVGVVAGWEADEVAGLEAAEVVTTGAVVPLTAEVVVPVEPPAEEEPLMQLESGPDWTVKGADWPVVPVLSRTVRPREVPTA